mgnify:CR=1 FL=1
MVLYMRVKQIIGWFLIVLGILFIISPFTVNKTSIPSTTMNLVLIISFVIGILLGLKGLSLLERDKREANQDELTELQIAKLKKKSNKQKK